MRSCMSISAYSVIVWALINQLILLISFLKWPRWKLICYTPDLRERKLALIATELKILSKRRFCNISGIYRGVHLINQFIYTVIFAIPNNLKKKQVTKVIYTSGKAYNNLQSHVCYLLLKSSNDNTIFYKRKHVKTKISLQNQWYIYVYTFQKSGINPSSQDPRTDSYQTSTFRFPILAGTRKFLNLTRFH